MRPFKSFLTTLVSFVLILLSTTAFGQSGCTSSSACNYDPTAITNDGSCCFAECITIEVIPDTYFSLDNSYWEIWDDNGNVQATGTEGITEVCLTSACFRFVMYDDYGDGWGTGSYTITTNGLVVANADTFPSGYQDDQAIDGPDCYVIWGCNLPFACNYSILPTAYDGSCTFSGCTDPSSLNYNPNAGCDDGSCTTNTACAGDVAASATGLTLDFVGLLSPEYWTPLVEGSGNLSHDAFHMLLTASNASTSSGSLLTQSTITAPRSGTYSFDWEFHSDDTGANYEIGYYINGTRINVTDVTGELNQLGSTTFTASVGDVIGFGIESVDDVGNPAYFLISNFHSPAECGCLASSACNYNPAATGGLLSDCNWDCYTCFGPESVDACNVGEAGVLAENNSINDIYFDILSTFPSELITNVEAYLDDQVFTPPCIADDITLCSALEYLWVSDAYAQVLPYEISNLDLPYINYSTEFLGMHGGYNSYLTAQFNCEKTSAVFAAYPGTSTTIHIYVPDNITYFNLIGNGDASNSITLHLHPTTPFVDNFTGDADVVIVFDEVKKCGCADELACNYDPSATVNDRSCEYPVGCHNGDGVNYNPLATCGDNCYVHSLCGYIDDHYLTTRMVGFNGDYQPDEWSVDDGGGIGQLGFLRETRLVIDGDRTISPDGPWTTVTVPTPVSGKLSFNYWWWIDYGATGTHAELQFLLDGEWQTLEEGYVPQNRSGSRIFDVTAGGEIGFRISSSQSEFGVNALSITSFYHPVEPFTCIPGCTDMLACNYNSDATGDDSSCEYTSCAGCTYPEAANYDSEALIEDGSCSGFVSADCPTDLDGDGFTLSADLLLVLGSFGSACP